MAEIDFEEALARAQAGDEDSFAVIWRALHPRLLRYLRVLAPSAADDLASECWLSVMRGLERFRGDETKFTSWLFTIARNKVTDWRRHERRRPADRLDDGIADTIVSLDDTERTALGHLDTDAALKLIATLPPDQAEIIILRVVAGLEVADVARIVHKSPGSVRVISHRALRRLRDRLATSTEREPPRTLRRPGDSGTSARQAVTP